MRKEFFTFPAVVLLKDNVSPLTSAVLEILRFSQNGINSRGSIDHRLLAYADEAAKRSVEVLDHEDNSANQCDHDIDR